MLLINQNPTPIQQPVAGTAFRSVKKPTAKELRKFQQLLDEQAFIARMKNPLISKAEKEVHAINYATKKFIEASTTEKIGMYIKAFGAMCWDGVKSVFKK